MDKNTYETYEFLSTENDDNQFLVVQDNGTFLINRPIELISQAQDEKAVLEEVEPCTVYDESSQQFFVNDSEELITDQFVVPNAENNVYTNGFFLQTIENLKDEETNEIINEYDEAPIETTESPEEKLTGACTEITLSDEQYQLLQDKGWILLETNDKKYLLDSVGLHDITNNEKLIEKLRNDAVDQNTEQEVISSTDSGKENDMDIKQEPVCYVMTDDLMQVEEGTQVVAPSFTQNMNDDSKVQIAHETLKTNKNILTLSQPNNIKTEKTAAVQLSHNPIKIKTKHLFKDIPPEIVLGRTVNGKKLVARVVKTNKPLCDASLNKHANNIRTQSEHNAPNCTGLSEIKFESLIRQKLNDSGEKCNTKDITAAEIVVAQLLRVPAFRPVVLERQLLVTKTILLETEVGTTYRESTRTLVTGLVTQEGPELRFTYVPDLLQKLLKDGEAILFFGKTKDVNESSFLHIHVCEMKGADGIVRISITLNKRHLPLRLVKEMNSRQSTVFACSACAAVFKTEDLLKQHQEAECMEVDDTLIIVTENNKNAYTVVNTGKEKRYLCNQCQTSFSKLNNCQKHVKTHFNHNNENNAIEDENAIKPKLEKVVFKCKMCPSTYFHPATLSKHIVAKHIKVRTK